MKMNLESIRFVNILLSIVSFFQVVQHFTYTMYIIHVHKRDMVTENAGNSRQHFKSNFENKTKLI